MNRILLFIFLSIQFTVSTTVKQYKEYKQTIKTAQTNYLKEDGYLTNEMDHLKIVEEHEWNGKKAPVWELNQIQYPHSTFASYQTFPTDERQAIVDENKAYMTLLLQHAFNGTLGRMPEDLGGDEQFEATSVNYEAKRVTIEYTIQTKIFDWRAVGWAFPGEIVTICFPQDMDISVISQMTIAIGKMNRVDHHAHLGTGNWDNIRMPIDTISFALKDHTQYIVNKTIKIGSPIGGMIYIQTTEGMRSLEPFTVTIKEAGIAPIFLFGQTTNADWENTLKNAPGNVMEMRTPGIRFVAVKSRIPQDFDPEFAMKHWYKAHSTADQVIPIPNLPIVLFFDQRVDAGAAVAFVGAYFTQHPSDWATGSLNKAQMINDGNWGTLHEFNHHKQNVGTIRWGIDPTGESTNNLLNTIHYIEYTNIHGNRHLGFSGWNWVTDANETMSYVVRGDNTAQLPLQMYATTIHAFGSQKMLNIMRRYETQQHEFKKQFNGTSIGSGEAYCYFAALEVERDTRYICSLFNFSMSDKVANAIQALNKPTWYPFQNAYCNSYEGHKYGRTYKIQFKQPFIINFTKTTSIDLNATNVIITFTQQPKGTVTKITENVYEYTPNLSVGEITAFAIKISCKIKNQDVVVNLQGEFECIGGQATEVKEYPVINATTVDKCLEEIASKTPSRQYSTNVLGIPNYESGTTKVFNIAEGKLLIDKEGWYTLYMRADDHARVFLTIDNVQVKIAEITHDLQGYSSGTAGSFKTVYLKNGSYSFTIYNYNGGGKGHAQMGYCFHGVEENKIDNKTCKVENIPQSMVLHKDLTEIPKEREFVIPEIKYWRKGRFLTHGYRSMPVCVTGNDANCFVNCTQLPPRHDATSVCSNIFDKTSSMYHSQYNRDTPFPTTYEFKFKSAISFNSIYLNYRKNRDSWGNYTMYGKLGSSDFAVFKVVNNTSIVEQTLQFDKIHTYDTIKVIVESNSQKLNFVNIVEFEPTISTKPYANYSKPFGDNIQTNSGFDKVFKVGAFGNYLVQNTREGSGELCFNFKGKRFGLYGHRTSTSGKGKVKFNGGEEHFDQSYYLNASGTLFYFKEYDQTGDKNICIEVTSGFINIDIIGFE